LEQVEEKVAEKEAVLQELLPEWEEQRALESTEKRHLDEASANLNSLFAKQGRVTKFRTKSERDAFLRHEIASVSAYKNNQVSALEVTRRELETGKQSQNEIDTLIETVHGKIEDVRQKTKEISENLAGLKEEHTNLTEKRKDLWREDSKVDNLVSRASDELRTAERALAGMMDKVSCACSVLYYESIIMIDGRILAKVFGLLTKSLNDIIFPVSMVLYIAFSKLQTPDSILLQSLRLEIGNHLLL
jgi:structural maintenance of chromosome 3 (chondroitin sulfate proteoglycan 6)